MASIVTPWEVSGDVDYSKLIREFGVSTLGDLPREFSANLLFRRKKVFAHRDFGRILEAVARKKPFVMMTGLMPTGKFHIGHALIAQQFIFYQSLGAKIYIAIADLEAYNARGQSLEESRRIAVEEYVANYIAMGLKPRDCEIYFQSNRSFDGARASAYYRLQNLLARHATFNEFKAVYGDIGPAKMVSGLLQAADMLHPQLPEFEGPLPVVVPVGIDQDPHIRLARDMCSRQKVHKLVQLSSTYNIFVPGLGGGKMSSSDPTSHIAFTDDDKTIKQKINKYAFSGGKETVEQHRKHGGDPSIDISYQLLTFFEEDDNKLKKVHDDYRSGRLLSGELKAILIDKLCRLIGEQRAKRQLAIKSVDKFISKT